MKQLPQKFLDALKNLLLKEDKQVDRMLEKMNNEPDKCAERIVHDLGSQTGPIKFSK